MRLRVDGYVAAVGTGVDGVSGETITGAVISEESMSFLAPYMLWRSAGLRHPDRAALFLSQPLSHGAVGSHEVSARQHRADQPSSALPGITASYPARGRPRPARSGAGASLDDDGARRTGRRGRCRAAARYVAEHGGARRRRSAQSWRRSLPVGPEAVRVGGWERHAPGSSQGGGDGRAGWSAAALDGAGHHRGRPRHAARAANAVAPGPGQANHQ